MFKAEGAPSLAFSRNCNVASVGQGGQCWSRMSNGEMVGFEVK